MEKQILAVVDRAPYSAVLRAMPWSTCPVDACEIPARKIHHYALGLYS
jgi:hypothetical protein